MGQQSFCCWIWAIIMISLDIYILYVFVAAFLVSIFGSNAVRFVNFCQQANWRSINIAIQIRKDLGSILSWLARWLALWQLKPVTNKPWKTCFSIYFYWKTRPVNEEKSFGWSRLDDSRKWKKGAIHYQRYPFLTARLVCRSPTKGFFLAKLDYSWKFSKTSFEMLKILKLLSWINLFIL